jgi:hypothetical protein
MRPNSQPTKILKDRRGVVRQGCRMEERAIDRRGERRIALSVSPSLGGRARVMWSGTGMLSGKYVV